MIPQLRDYQASAVQAGLLGVSEGVPTVLVSPTGSGKSVIGMSLVRHLTSEGKRVAWVTHRDHLIQQMRAHARDWEIPYGVVKAGQMETPDAPLQICSVHTARRRDVWNRVQVCVLDECHREDVTGPVMKRAEGIPRIGLTASPIASDGDTLGRWFQHLVVAALPSQLLAQRAIVPARMFLPHNPELANVRSRGGDFDQRQLENVMARMEVTGNILRHWETWAKGQPTVVFAVSQQHARQVAEAFKTAGWGAAVVTADTPDAERDHIQARFRAGSIHVLVNCSIFVEGYDLPSIRCVVDAHPTKSLARALQQAGRGSRPEPGKADFILMDHAGNVMRHRPPHVDRLWTLLDRKENGTESAVARENLGIRYCPDCFFAYTGAGACPNCGSRAMPRRAVREKAGNLVEKTEAEIQALLAPTLQASEALDRYRRHLYAKHRYAPPSKRHAIVKKELAAFTRELMGAGKNGAP